jgi:hypothetical protein
MSNEHIKIYSGSSTLARRLRHLIEDAGMGCIVKSDKIPAYEIGNDIDELFVLESDLEKAKTIVESFEKEIES